jgi:FdhD protein
MPSPPASEEDAALPAGAVRRKAERCTYDNGGHDDREHVIDAVAEEIPVAFIYNGRPHAVMMATPANFEDFALGFSLSEAIIAGASECEKVEIVEALAGIELHIAIPEARGAVLEDRVRQLTGRTGCGLCGAQTLEAAVRHPPPVADPLPIDAVSLQIALTQLQGEQKINAATGATHAAAWVSAYGHIELLREDVGRHNALDKVLGAMWRAGKNPRDGFLLITSRASFEMVMKAATAGIGVLAAISAPTALAIALAEETRMTLICFAREHGHVIYSNPQRLVRRAGNSP